MYLFELMKFVFGQIPIKSLTLAYFIYRMWSFQQTNSYNFVPNKSGLAFLFWWNCELPTSYIGLHHHINPQFTITFGLTFISTSTVVINVQTFYYLCPCGQYSHYPLMYHLKLISTSFTHKFVWYTAVLAGCPYQYISVLAVLAIKCINCCYKTTIRY